MDTCKIGPGLYQYTSINGCTRYRVLRIYKRRTAANTLDFIDAVTEEMPFPIQRIQTDRGREFFAVKVQEKLMGLGIKFRPNKQDRHILTERLNAHRRLIRQSSTQPWIQLQGILMNFWPNGSTTTTGTALMALTKEKHQWSVTLNYLKKLLFLKKPMLTISLQKSVYKNLTIS